ncbi:MAG: ATP-dependent metallopeptidase FtsH/Yme1/Tma family protein [Terriglobales bacterium]|jgi:cell division protease FtsH
MNGAAKTVLFWVVIVVSSFLLWQVMRSGSTAKAIPEISYSEFLTRVASGQISKVMIAGGVVRGSDAKGGDFRVVAPANQAAMLDVLQQHGVEIWFKEIPEQSWRTWVFNLVPLILLAAVWFFMVRQMQRRRSGGDEPSSYTPQQGHNTRFGP